MEIWIEILEEKPVISFCKKLCQKENQLSLSYFVSQWPALTCLSPRIQLLPKCCHYTCHLTVNHWSDLVGWKKLSWEQGLNATQSTHQHSLPCFLSSDQRLIHKCWLLSYSTWGLLVFYLFPFWREDGEGWKVGLYLFA